MARYSYKEGTMDDVEARPQVVLMQYKNERHEPVYAYVRVEGDKATLLKAATEEGFSEGSLGRTVASGRGEPPEEIRAIIAARYDCFCRYVRENARSAMA